MTGEAHAVDHVLTYVYRARFDYKTFMEKRPPSTIEQLIMWVRCFAADFSNHARNVQYVGHPIQQYSRQNARIFSVARGASYIHSCLKSEAQVIWP